MRVTEIAPGLWRWTALHPDWRPSEAGQDGWGEEVGCVYLETEEAIVLVDPLVPPEDAERFWAALRRDVEVARLPVHVVVTVIWHARSAGEIARSLAGRVWAPARGRAAVKRRTGVVTDVFRAGDRLPGGIEAFATAPGSELVLWIPAHRTLVPGDVLLGTGGGGVRLCPDSWLPRREGGALLRATLAPLLDLPIERVLVSHGEPVLADGAAALRRALAS